MCVHVLVCMRQSAELRDQSDSSSIQGCLDTGVTSDLGVNGCAKAFMQTVKCRGKSNPTNVWMYVLTYSPFVPWTCHFFLLISSLLAMAGCVCVYNGVKSTLDHFFCW